MIVRVWNCVTVNQNEEILVGLASQTVGQVSLNMRRLIRSNSY